MFFRALQTQKCFNNIKHNRFLHDGFLNKFIDFYPSVGNALINKKPIVALESTIITHGMPYPQNLETALEVEDIIKQKNVTPATIAIINGRVKIGLSVDDIKYLSEQNKANPNHEVIHKVSRADLAMIISDKKSGSTTVAATMILANLVGIKIFATGGVGGVHRHAENTLDISADLTELGKTPITVVCSGVKSILDIPKTLEFLETQGVCVTSYNNDHFFPEFYMAKGENKVLYNLETPQQAANLIKCSQNLKLDSGILIGVPIPDKFSIDKLTIQTAIEDALILASSNNISGKEVTPFLLQAVSEKTNNKSLLSNIALIKNNASVASEIALALNDIVQTRVETKKFPVVIGASIADIYFTTNDDLQLNGSTFKCSTNIHGGGVGRNIAEALCKLSGEKVAFISAIGNDAVGNILLDTLPNNIVPLIYRESSKATSLCSILIDKFGDCKLCLGDMAIHDDIKAEQILENENTIARASIIIMDANISLKTMETVLTLCKKYNVPIFYEPTDMNIAAKPFQLPRESTKQIKYISPNIYELEAIYKQLTGKDNIEMPPNSTLLEKSFMLLNHVSKHIECIILTLGEMGIIVKKRNSAAVHYPIPNKVKEIVNVSGAGDSFVSGFISGLTSNLSEDKCISLGFYAASKALQSESAVPRNYFDKKVETLIQPLS